MSHDDVMMTSWWRYGTSTYNPCLISHLINRYRWVKNGRDLDLNRENIFLDPETGTITINPLTSLDKGYYQCVAFNMHGAALSRVVFLQRALLAPYPPQTSPDPYIGREGEPFMLPCKGTKSVPEATFRWSTIASITDSRPSPIHPNNVINIDPEGKPTSPGPVSQKHLKSRNRHRFLFSLHKIS